MAVQRVCKYALNMQLKWRMIKQVFDILLLIKIDVLNAKDVYMFVLHVMQKKEQMIFKNAMQFRIKIVEKLWRVLQEVYFLD